MEWQSLIETFFATSSVDDFKEGKLPSSDQEIQIHTW